MLNYITTRVKHCKYICTNYSHRFQQNMLNFLLGANRPGAKRLGGRNDQERNVLGRNAFGAKRLGGELDLGRNDPDSSRSPEFGAEIRPHSQCQKVCFFPKSRRKIPNLTKLTWSKNTTEVSLKKSIKAVRKHIKVR